MRKKLFCFLLVVLCIPTLVGARSLFEIDLGVSGIYNTDSPDTVESFFEGMGSGDNWTVGIGVNTRLSLFNISFLAMVPNGGEEELQKLGLLTSLTIDIPLITNGLYLNVGGGLTTDFTFASDGSETRILHRPAADVTFLDVVEQSPIHLKYGLDVLFGSAKIGLFYLIDTKATMKRLAEPEGWADLFTSTGQDKVGVMLQLALF
ncbi:MAG: hypothetical protein WCS59_06065 [Sphaerochaetaceae bacterium]|jgi:hypothetical protein|nr:hypothetical protein [Sphaerochaetaceae bacterium]MDD4219239.1 hypothetical protein [Sphaerochaetaceae bacterium]MDY0370925.1 hypothetical protein [Sphaerochaetaceae bacterium]